MSYHNYIPWAYATYTIKYFSVYYIKLQFSTSIYLTELLLAFENIQFIFLDVFLGNTSFYNMIPS